MSNETTKGKMVLREKGGDGLPVPNGEPAAYRELNCTKLGGKGDNHNKVYAGEWYPDTPGVKSGYGVSLFWWGALGADFGNYMTRRHTLSDFNAAIEKKMRDSGYTEQQFAKPIVEVVADEVDKSNNALAVTRPALHPQVIQITSKLFRAAGESVKQYLVEDIPLSRLPSLDQINRGRQLLVDAENAWTAYVAARGTRDENFRRETYNRIIEDYLSTIPMRVDRPIVPQRVQEKFATSLSDHYDHLNRLEAQLAGNKVQIKGQPQVADPQYDLGMRLTYIEHGDPLWKQIEAEVLSTAVTKDGRVAVQGRPLFKIDDIFAVNIAAERAAYNAYLETWNGRSDPDKLIGRLYHATWTANVRHIVGKSGLIINKVVANGSRFGRGIYFADMSARSWTYTGTSSNEFPRIMFVADVALGRMKDLPNDNQGLRSAPAGHDSVRGVKSHSNMDEFIVYSAQQQTLRLMLCLSPIRY